jgi:hypothetical protein
LTAVLKRPRVNASFDLFDPVSSAGPVRRHLGGNPVPKTCVYVPFDHDAKLLRQGANIAKQYDQLGCRTTKSSLSDVTKLIIVAHSAANTGLLSDSDNWSMNAMKLAEKLKGQGLNYETCKQIEVFACEAGHAKRTSGGERPFDEQLADALKAVGVGPIVVSAFSTTVGSDAAGRQYVKPDGFTQHPSGSNRKATIDPRRIGH